MSDDITRVSSHHGDSTERQQSSFDFASGDTPGKRKRKDLAKEHDQAYDEQYKRYHFFRPYVPKEKRQGYEEEFKEIVDEHQQLREKAEKERSLSFQNTFWKR